jgi:hypothetical protein
MKTNEELLEEISQISKIRDFENMTEPGVEKILNLIGEHRLSKAHIEALVKVAPSFASLSVEALKTISLTAKEAGSSQKEIINNFRASIEGISNVFSILSNNAETDETRLKIAEYMLKAGELYCELAKIQVNINKDNNETWIKIAAISLAVVAAATGITVASMQNARNS